MMKTVNKSNIELLNIHPIKKCLANNTKSSFKVEVVHDKKLSINLLQIRAHNLQATTNP